MIPNMYKIAGELTAAVLHVAARSLAAQGLSIFGDHSDVMAVRQTGFALLASASVQEAHDLALVAQAATLATRVPFVHFFDGFRTSHELNTIELLSDDDLRALVPEELVRAHRGRALVAGAAVHPRHRAEPGCLLPGPRDRQPVLRARSRAPYRTRWTSSAQRTGRHYRLVDYSGHPEAERVLVVMGSGGETAARQWPSCRRRVSGSAWRRSGCTGRSRRGRWSQALPASVRADRRARPDQGAGFVRRAAVPRRGRGTQRVIRRRRARADAERDRRPLRPVLEGVHARDGRRRVRGTGA